MTNPIVKIVNAETGEEIERPMTKEEFDDYQNEKMIAETKRSEEIKKSEAKAALLERLGITAEEAALLLA